MNNNFTDVQILNSLEHIVFNLHNGKLESAVDQTMNLYDTNFPYSFNIVLCNFVFSAFIAQKGVEDKYLNYLVSIQAKEKEKNLENSIMKIFSENLSNNKSQESHYLLEKMISKNLIDKNIVERIDSRYFIHYMDDIQIDSLISKQFSKYFSENYSELSKNDWELHKKYVKEGHHPLEIAKVLRSDEIEKLQEISSQSNFDFNQTIEPSLYERCSFINKENVTLIDYAAFFSSVKCFKYLLMNNAKVENTGKYAVASGNLELIHLCEQNHSSFEGAYEAAIIFHKNDIFKYIYEKKLDRFVNYDFNDINYYYDYDFVPISFIIGRLKPENINNLGVLCEIHNNYEIFSFLKRDGMLIDSYIINESARSGNLYLLKHFLENNFRSGCALVVSSLSNNIEIVKLLLEQEGIDINAKDIFMFYLIFI